MDDQPFASSSHHVGMTHNDAGITGLNAAVVG